jgi:hypothetical protein
MTELFMQAAAAGFVLVFSSAANGHHSFDAVFDRELPVELTGTVTAFEWTNPHVWFFVEVGNEPDEMETWSFEMGSPNALIRRGWSHDSLRSGSRVTVHAVRARDGSRRGAALSVTLGSGQKLFGAQNLSR